MAVTLADLPLREDLRGRPYGAPQLTSPVRLNTNENPLPAAAGAGRRRHGRRRARSPRELHRYPDRDAVALRTDLAAYLTAATGVPLDARTCGPPTGPTRCCSSSCRRSAGRGARRWASSRPTRCTRSSPAGTRTDVAARAAAADFSLDVAAAAAAPACRAPPDVTFLTSPNNPTGQSLDPDDLARADRRGTGHRRGRRGLRRVLRPPSAVELLGSHGHKLIVSRTMSKAFAFAGGRLGYLAAAPAVVDALQLVRLPYHLSVLTQAAARAALRHADATLARWRRCAPSATGSSPRSPRSGYAVVPSDANFMLFGRFADAPRGVAGVPGPRRADPRRRDSAGTCGSPSARRRRTTRSSRAEVHGVERADVVEHEAIA